RNSTLNSYTVGLYEFATANFAEEESLEVEETTYQPQERRERGGTSHQSRVAMLQLEQFPHALDLAAADGNFGLLFVAHFPHVSGLEPRHHFLDVMNVDEEGAMRAPERVRIKRGGQFIECAIVRSAFHVLGHDGDVAFLNGSPDQIFGVHKQQALLRFHQNLHRLRGALFRTTQLADELLEPLGGTGLRFNFFARALDGFRNARLVERLQNVIDRIYIKRLHRVMIEGRRKNNVRNFGFALHEFF